MYSDVAVILLRHPDDHVTRERMQLDYTSHTYDRSDVWTCIAIGVSIYKGELARD